MFEFKRYKTYTIAILLLIVSYFALFEHLGYEPMHLWDESSYALNAQEMLERGNPIELYLLDEPDLYNTKPPLAIWCMATSIHFLGFNEIGARLPSVLFALGAVFLLFFIGLRVTGDSLSAAYAPLVLLSSTGFVNEHIARTGDTDCMLAFWILAQSVCFFLYTDTEDIKKQRLLLFATALLVSMGCLTKGVAGLIALPGLLAWLFYKRKGKQLFTSPVLYWGIAVFVLLVPGYYVIRNVLTPGYLDAVFNFEVGGRMWQQEFLNPEYRPFYYFYQSMAFEGRLVTWIFILPAAIVIILTSGQSKVKSLGLVFVFALTGVSVVLGLSSTKLFWYDAPMYPLIAGIIGSAFAIVLPRLQPYGMVLFLSILCWPLTAVLRNNLTPTERTHFPAYLKQLRQSEHQNDSIFIINADQNFPLHFYVKQDQMNGFYSKLVHPSDTILKTGSLIITEKEAREVDMHRKFILDTLGSFYECRYYKIVGYK